MQLVDSSFQGLNVLGCIHEVQTWGTKQRTWKWADRLARNALWISRRRHGGKSLFCFLPLLEDMTDTLNKVIRDHIRFMPHMTLRCRTLKIGKYSSDLVCEIGTEFQWRFKDLPADSLNTQSITSQFDDEDLEYRNLHECGFRSSDKFPTNIVIKPYCTILLLFHKLKMSIRYNWLCLHFRVYLMITRKHWFN
jgi:hypothetical protein